MTEIGVNIKVVGLFSLAQAPWTFKFFWSPLMDRYPLPWSILKYDTSMDGYVVPIEKSTLEKAPRYASDSRPDYDDEYGREVYGYYGANW